LLCAAKRSLAAQLRNRLALRWKAVDGLVWGLVTYGIVIY
jgi:hypothetical protein